MDKLQEVFEQQFAEQLKTLIDNALAQVDVAELVERTVKQRLDSGEKLRVQKFCMLICLRSCKLCKIELTVCSVIL